jgi:hypothetical protein
MPLLDGLKVIRSSIHGYGVIATRRFDVGEIILYGDGFLYAEEDDFDDEYALIVPIWDDSGDELASMYYDLTCQSRWINHSCEPNTEVDVALDQLSGSVTAWWTALREIRAGDELTYDYAFAGHLAIPCSCGSANCRGLIVDPDEIGKVPPELRNNLRVPEPVRRLGS